MSTLYRKRPVTIEAMQLTTENHAAVAKWCNGKHRGILLPPHEQIIQIETLEGEVTARVGDYVIKGVQGEFYPCKPDIFAQTYEKVTN